MYSFFYPFIWVIALLPFRMLYLFSNVLYLVVYHLAGYRKKVVRKNLLLSFPNKSIREIKSIEQSFYRYFCDLMFEIVKQLHLSPKEMRERMVFEDIDLIIHQARKGKSVMLMTGHYCNWEWASSICLHLPDDYLTCPVYQELTNAHFDKLMLRLRNSYGSVSVEKDALVRSILEMQKQGIHGLFGMISDQSPMKKHIRFRMNFLNQDTPVFLGTEQLATKYDYPVFYLEMSRPKRGYYHCVVKPIAMEPKQTTQYEITTKFMKMLETNIQASPEFWLWSHNRWKHAQTINS